MARSSKPTDFEQALGELEKLVERLERGDLPLEEALKDFERGVELARHCQSALRAAQQKVEILLRRNTGEVEVATFVSEEEPAAGEPAPAGEQTAEPAPGLKP